MLAREAISTCCTNELVTTIDLSQWQNTCKLFKTLISKYGIGLETFIEEHCLRFAEINIGTSLLYLHGNPRNVEKAENAIAVLAKSISLEDEQKVITDVREICSACRLPPLQLSLRLKSCSHLYCIECVNGLILNSSFPIQCCAQDCSKKLVFEDIRKGLDYDEDAINDFMLEFLADFMSVIGVFYYCPTPDCNMFYNALRLNQRVWRCTLCETDICTQCHEVDHKGQDCRVVYCRPGRDVRRVMPDKRHLNGLMYLTKLLDFCDAPLSAAPGAVAPIAHPRDGPDKGVTCDMYQHTKEDADYSYNVWQDSKANSKLCPKCKSGVERNAGCNHMYCTNCETHFCWRCMRDFPTGDEAYPHTTNCNTNLWVL